MEHIDLVASKNPFLEGTSFSPGLSVEGNFSRTLENLDRLAFLSRYVEGKSVLHVGCADHAGLIRKKHAEGRWLHSRLLEKARSLVGIDISEQGIREAQSLGVPNLHQFDVLNPGSAPEIGSGFDVLLLGEVLEHIPDPAIFLRALHFFRATKLLLTVPNGFDSVNFLNAIRGRELINSDHRYWFTPYTISKVMADASWKVTSVTMIESGGLERIPRHPARALHRFVKSNFRFFRDTLVVEAQPS